MHARLGPRTHRPTAAVLRCSSTPLRAIRIAGYVWRTSKRLPLIERGGEEAARQARHLARDTADAGVLFIKMAQFISARSDVVQNPDVMAALESLQDAVPVEPGPPPEVEGVVVDAAPMASASVADVYSGVRLDDGARVAVKRVRQGVRESIQQDLPLLIGVLRLAKALDVAGAANMVEIVQECAPMLLEELDLRNEARAQAAVRAKFAGNARLVVVPEVVHASPDIMVSMFVGSRKITSAVPTPWLARRLFELYVRMVLAAGIVHADPHAGNIGVRPDGTLVLYDFGATVEVGSIRPYVATLFRSLAMQDVDAGLDAMVKMGVLKDDPVSVARVKRVAPTLRRLLANPATINDELAKMPEFTGNEGRVFCLTTTYVYLIRSLVIVQGLIKYHDPDFELDEYMDEFEDLIEELVEELVEDVPPWGVARDVATDVMSMPSSLRSMQASMTDLSLAMTSGMNALLRGLTVNVALLLALLLLFK